MMAGSASLVVLAAPSTASWRPARSHAALGVLAPGEVRIKGVEGDTVQAHVDGELPVGRDDRVLVVAEGVELGEAATSRSGH